MENFKVYSFSRLIAKNELEFFFILGLPNPENYSENWDGTGHTVVGYLAMYKKHDLKEIKNIIYLLSDYKSNFGDIERYTHQFAKYMISAEVHTYDIQFKVKQTKVKGSSVGPPYIDFVKIIVGNDIPESILNDIKV